MVDRRNFLSLVVAAGAAGAGLAGCSKKETPKAVSEPKSVKLGDTVAETNPEIAAERFFADRFNKLCNNRYQVEVVPGGALGDHNRMNQDVRDGNLELTKTFFPNLTAFDKRLGVLSVPYLFAKQADLFTALDGDLGKEIKTILAGQGLILLGFFDSGARNVYNKMRPIRTPDDIKGLRLRVPQDQTAIDTFSSLGAQPVPLTTNEILPAFQQGVIDGAENNIVFYLTNKHSEQAKYWSWTRHQYGVDAVLASKKWFDTLSRGDQDALVQAGTETVSHERELWRAQTETYATQARDSGVQINDDVDVFAFQQVLKPVLAKSKATFGDLTKLIPSA